MSRWAPQFQGQNNKKKPNLGSTTRHEETNTNPSGPTHHLDCRSAGAALPCPFFGVLGLRIATFQFSLLVFFSPKFFDSMIFILFCIKHTTWSYRLPLSRHLQPAPSPTPPHQRFANRGSISFCVSWLEILGFFG